MSDTTNEMLYSDVPWAIIRTFTFFLATAVKTLAATPGEPFIPEPTTAITHASFSSLTFSTSPSPLNDNWRLLAPRSTSFFATPHDNAAPDHPCEIITTLTL